MAKKAEFEKFYNECRTAIAHLEEYVDENLEPYLDPAGKPLFEVKVLTKLSPKAKEFASDFFKGVINSAKKMRASSQDS